MIGQEIDQGFICTFAAMTGKHFGRESTKTIQFIGSTVLKKAQIGIVKSFDYTDIQCEP